MRVFAKIMMSSAALAFAGGMMIATAQAAPIVGKPAVAAKIEVVAAAKKKAKKKGPGSCGTMMYWDKKAKACADATKKK
jgi:TfoX/Sxy family transcriptional regulator of competence genes